MAEIVANIDGNDFQNDSAGIVAGRHLFLVILAAYCIFPTEDGIKTLGVGPEGSRILLLDLVVGSLVLFCSHHLGMAVRKIFADTGYLPWMLFCGASLLSTIRGTPLYGGMALGEARWFACVLLVPVGYWLASRRMILNIERVFLVTATLQAGWALYQISTGQSWDESDVVMRFAGGRQALVISLGILVLLHRWFDRNRKPFRDGFLALFFAATLLAIQTRSLFLFLPLIALIYVGLRAKFRIEFAKRAFRSSILFCSMLAGIYFLLLPKDVQRSVDSSVKVLVEAFSPTTIQFVLNPDVGDGSIAGEFSKSGNTAFRLMAWSQVLSAIDETPGGWFVGMPMGAGFYFTDPSGHSYENLEPHNDYISILSKIGLVGLCGYFLILIRYLWLVVRTSMSGSTACSNMDYLLWASFVLLLSLYGSLNAEMRTYGTHFWLWPLLGMGLRLVTDAQESSSGGTGEIHQTE